MMFMLLLVHLPPEVLKLAVSYEQSAYIQTKSGWEMDEQALFRLERELSPWRFSENHRLDLGQLLASYWRNYYQETGAKLQPFAQPRFNGFYESRLNGNVSKRILFAEGLLYHPGRPFSDGDLLWFDHQGLALKMEGELTMTPLPFQPAQASTYFEFDQMLDANLFNFLFGQLDRAFILMGKPQRLDGQFLAESPEMLLNKLITHFGYSLIMDAKMGFILLRPGFDTSSLEQALKNVSISDRGGYLSGAPLLEAQKESFSLSNWMEQPREEASILDNYAVGYEIEGQYQLVRLSETEKVIQALFSLEITDDPCDRLKRFIRQSCLNRDDLIPKLKSDLRHAFTEMGFEADSHKRLAEKYLKCF